MRVTSISMANSHYFAPKKNINKISFGLIEKENREKILQNLPFENEDSKEWNLYNMEENQGTIVRWGGKNHPRGLIYADLIMEHVNKSCMKEDYLELTPEYDQPDYMKKINVCTEHLEVNRNFQKLCMSLDEINSRENPDGSPVPKSKPLESSSSTNNSDPLADDATYQAYKLYGV